MGNSNLKWQQHWPLLYCNPTAITHRIRMRTRVCIFNKILQLTHTHTKKFIHGINDLSYHMRVFVWFVLSFALHATLSLSLTLSHSLLLIKYYFCKLNWAIITICVVCSLNKSNAKCFKRRYVDEKERKKNAKYGIMCRFFLALKFKLNLKRERERKTRSQTKSLAPMSMFLWLDHFRLLFLCHFYFYFRAIN